MHPNQLHGWRKEARSGSLSITPCPQACFAAVEIADQVALTAPAVIPEAPPSLIIEVVLRNGRLVRFPERIGARRAARLADALDGSEQ